MKDKMSIDMTHGPLFGKILLFSLPLMASNILQLLFNAADTVVVGRFCGSASLAALGSTVSLIFLVINILIGLSIGVNVAVARYLGLGNSRKEISLMLHTSILVALIGGAVLGCLGAIASEWMLRLISVPDDVLPLATVYLRVYFLGTPFNMLYNYGAAALRAKGDTRRPLIFLTISGIINVVLNLFFVIAFRMDVLGVALATIISQAISGFLVLACMARSDDELHFSWKQLCFHMPSFLEMVRIGVPAGIQASLFSLANVTIQGAINSYNSVILAGSSASSNLEGFVYNAMYAFHVTCQTFTSQNIGAGRYDRIARIVRTCILCVLVLGAGMAAIAVLFADPLLSIYTSDPDVIAAGAYRLVIMVVPYAIYGMADVLVGAIRGSGVPIAPVIINLLCTCVTRILWVSVLDTSTHGVQWVYYAFPVTWVLLFTVLSVFWAHLCHRNRDKRNAARLKYQEEG